MKIKKIGFTTFQIKEGDVTIVTDPFAYNEFVQKPQKITADVVVSSEKKYISKTELVKELGLEKKIVPKVRESVFEVINPGEFEIGGVLVRKGEDGIIILDSGSERLVYIGFVKPDLEISAFKGMGDVDALIIPVGDGAKKKSDGKDKESVHSVYGFMSTSKVEKVISTIDPGILIPAGYKEPGLKEGDELITVDEFMKECGFSGAEKSADVKVSGSRGADEKAMSITILE